MLQTTSAERRAAGGARPRSGGDVKMRPVAFSDITPPASPPGFPAPIGPLRPGLYGQPIRSRSCMD